MRWRPGCDQFWGRNSGRRLNRRVRRVHHRILFGWAGSGELELDIQAKLLRFLEEKSFRRVGGTRDIHVSLRVIAAIKKSALTFEFEDVPLP